MTGTAARVDEWLARAGSPSESMISWATLGYPQGDPSEGGGRVRPIDTYVTRRALDAAAQVGQGHSQLVVVVTDRRLLFLSVGGLVRVKPRDLVAEAPVASSRLEWWDQREIGPDRRWLLFELGASWLSHVAMVKGRTNIEALTDALGTRAVHVGHPDGGPLR